jgi:hypothetical protein
MLETRQRLMMVMPLEVIEAGQGIYLDLKRASPWVLFELLPGCGQNSTQVRTLWIHRPRLLQEMSVAQVQLTWIYIDVWGSREALRTTTCPFDRGEKVVEVQQGSCYLHTPATGRAHSQPTLLPRGREGGRERQRDREREKEQGPGPGPGPGPRPRPHKCARWRQIKMSGIVPVYQRSEPHGSLGRYRSATG